MPTRTRRRMSSDDRLVDLVERSMARAQQLSQACREQGLAVGDLNRQLTGVGNQVENSLQQAESALASLGARITQLEGEMGDTLRAAQLALEQARSGYADADAAHHATGAEVDAAWQRLRAGRQLMVDELNRELVTLRQNLTTAEDSAYAAGQAVTIQALKVQQQLAGTRRAVAQSRESLEQQARSALAESAASRESLARQVKDLVQQCERCRPGTRQELDTMARHNELCKDKSDAEVANRFEVQLAERCRQLSAVMGEAVTGRKGVVQSPRKEADQDIPGIILLLSETFPALENISKVFREAQKAGLC